MDTFFGWTAVVLATYFAGRDLLENDIPASDGKDVLSQGKPEDESDVFTSSTHAQPSEQGTYSTLAFPSLPGGFPASPPRSHLKWRAGHQHGPLKRQKVSTETHRSGSPSPARTRKRKGGNSKPTSSSDLEARPDVHLPNRAPSVSSTPVSHSEAHLSTFPSSTKDAGLDIQVVRLLTPGPTGPSPFVGAISDRGQPWPLVADNVVIGRKRPAAAEFNEEVSMPHRKKYITGWMSEYIRLRAPSWREMLRAMREARWRPFRPQVIRYLSPAPPSAPSTASRYRCASPITGDLPVITPTASSAPRAESPSPSPPPSFDDPSPSFPATTTPPYSPPESPVPFTPPSFLQLEVEAVTPPDTPTPPSGVAYSLAWSVQDRIDSPLSASRISWADKGKWRVDADPEQVAHRLDPFATEDVATDLSPFLPFPVTSLSPSLLDIPPSSTAPTTSPYLPLLATLRTDRPRPISNSKQSRDRQEGLRRLKSTRLEPTKLAYLRLRSQVKWRLQDICRRMQTADRPIPQMRTHFPPPPLPLPYPLAPPPHTLPPFALPVTQRAGTPRAAFPTPKRFKAIEHGLRFKTTRPKPFKMDYLRLRSEVRWRLKDLGFEKRPAPAPAVSTQPTQVHPVLVMIGPVPAWLWPASVFNSLPPGSVVLTTQRTDWDDGTRLSVLASQDSPKRAYRPRRRRRLIPSEPMEDVEFFGIPP